MLKKAEVVLSLAVLMSYGLGKFIILLLICYTNNPLCLTTMSAYVTSMHTTNIFFMLVEFFSLVIIRHNTGAFRYMQNLRWY